MYQWWIILFIIIIIIIIILNTLDKENVVLLRLQYILYI